MDFFEQILKKKVPVLLGPCFPTQRTNATRTSEGTRFGFGKGGDGGVRKPWKGYGSVDIS